MPLSLENLSPRQLLEEIAKMQANAIPKKMDIQERVFCAYREKTLYDLSLILKGDIFDSQIELAELLVDSTSQSQIASSDNGLTGSLSNGSLTLQKKVLNLQIRALKSFLADNWEMVNSTSLCYTAHPNSDLTAILCAVAKLVWDNKAIWMNDSKSWCVLKLLMPTVSTDSLDGTGKYPSLNEIDDIRQVLRTHILGREGKYLIPIKKLNELEGTSTKGWVNPYYDYQCHSEEMVGLNTEEHERLIRHSPYTRALFDAYGQYELSIKEQGSLLSHLRHLCSLLYFNSIHGTGEDKNAGTGAYEAIIRFSEYYGMLSDDTKDKIPPEVREQIELLIDLACKPDKNKNATDTDNIETCIASRREALDIAIRPVEHILASIGLSEDAKKNLVEEKKKQLIACEKAFEEAIAKQDYCGQDKLGITQQLMMALQVTLSISSPADLQELMKLSASEIASLCQLEIIQSQIINQFESFETVALFIHELPPEKLRAILPLIGTGLVKKFFLPTGEFTALLIIMNVERCQIICEALKNNLPQIIRHIGDFNTVLEPLSPEQRAVVYEAMQDNLPKIIRNGNDFKRVFQYLSPQQRIAVYKAMKDNLPEIISNGDDFKRVLRNLSPEQRTAVYEVMKDDMPKIIKNVVDFYAVLKWLSPEQRIAVYDQMKVFLPSFIKSADALRIVCRLLSPEQSREICVAIKERLPQLINDVDDLKRTLFELPPEVCTFVCAALKDQLPKIIQNSADFYAVLKPLSPEKKKAVYEVTKALLPQFIITANNFSGVFRWLSLEQCIEVGVAIKDHLPQLLNCINDLRHGLYALPPEQCTFVCIALKDRLQQLIKDADNFQDMFRWFSLEQCTAICIALKDYLPQIIASAGDFNTVLESLSPEQRTVVYKAMKDSLPLIIQDVNDFYYVLQWLSPEQKTALYDQMKKDRLPQLIESVGDFNILGKCLSSEQSTEACIALKDRLPQLIESASDLQSVLRRLSLTDSKDICVAIKNRLPEIINNVNNLNRTLKGLSPGHCAVVFEAIKDHLPHIIKNKNDFKSVFEKLSHEQRMAACQGMQEKLSQIIAINELLQYFPDDSQQKEVQQLYVASLKAVELNSDNESSKGKIAADEFVNSGNRFGWFKMPEQIKSDEKSEVVNQSDSNNFRLAV